MHYHRGIFLLSLPGKVYAKCLEKRCRERVEPQLQDAQCGFRPGRSTIGPDLCFSASFGETVAICQRGVYMFVDLEKAYDRVQETSCGQYC